MIMYKKFSIHLLVTFVAAVILAGCMKDKPAETTSPTSDAGLKVPDGFSANIVADDLGKVRHITVTPKGEIYARLGGLKDGKGTLLLTATDGKYAIKSSFGTFGGTGVFLKDGYLYASSDTEVYRFKLDENFQVIDAANAEKIVTGLIDRGQHGTKSIALDNSGNLYVNIGAYSNSCQEKDRQNGSLGMKPCPILDSAGGIWMFKASQLNQGYKEGVRYATGLRNVVGLDWNNEVNQLFVMQHGRDQLHDIFPDMYTVKQSADLPAEVMFAVKQGDNCGWPYTYYDGLQKKKMVAPEYGGDGKKEAGSEYIDPVASYPAHVAPNALLFYTGDKFPAKYKNGAFIAFHGSWNRAPEPQEGFYVVFQPFVNGKPSGDWEIFADGFSGSAENTASGHATHRPCGLAQGPDGSLFVSDDVKGTIYKIDYTASK
jgi:glucose/arabinose dehydrogenase